MRSGLQRACARRPGIGAGRRHGFRGVGVSGGGGETPGPQALDLLAGGSFSRSSGASYLTGPASIALASSGEMREEYDASLPGEAGLLIEATRTNIVGQSAIRDGWSSGSVTPVFDDEDGPLGASTAARVEFADASDYIAHPCVSTPADGASVRLSIWARGALGGEVIRLGLRQKDGVTLALGADLTLSTSWERYDVSVSAGSGASTPLFVVAAGSDGDPCTVYVACAQAEVGATFPSSWIETTTAAVARAADVRTFAVGEYPASFLTDGFRLTYVPLMSSAELIAGGGPLRMCSFATAQNYLEVLNAGGAIAVRAIEANSSRIARTPVTWSRGQPITITVRPSAGELTVEGATTGDGTSTGAPFSWPSGTLTWGANTSGSGPAMGRFSRYVAAL